MNESSYARLLCQCDVFLRFYHRIACVNATDQSVYICASVALPRANYCGCSIQSGRVGCCMFFAIYLKGASFAYYRKHLRKCWTCQEVYEVDVVPTILLNLLVLPILPRLCTLASGNRCKLLNFYDMHLECSFIFCTLRANTEYDRK